VFFAIPSFTHSWPNSAACWSPAIPAIGIRFSRFGHYAVAGVLLSGVANVLLIQLVTLPKYGC
jgi:putative copper export protein